MNINDVTEEIEVPKSFEEIWQAIFAKQKTLADKYADIEGMGNLLETTKTNIDTAKGQKWIKDFAWRVTEELTEAFEALEFSEKQAEEPEIMEQYMEHFKEELADALHFLVELSIIAGYNHDIVTRQISKPIQFMLEPDAWPVVYQMGLMCNCLKNKPWKQTQMLTDRPKFESYLEEVWTQMMRLLLISMDNYEQVYLYYFKKNKVNQFRQRSKY